MFDVFQCEKLGVKFLGTQQKKHTLFYRNKFSLANFKL